MTKPSRTVIEIDDDSVSSSPGENDNASSSDVVCQSPLHTQDTLDDEVEEINPTKCTDESYELVAPLSLLNGGGNECTLLVQVDTDDATTLDFHGASGAVGRFETNGDGVTMDLKGFQYHGTIHAGPTVLIASIVPNRDGKMMKVESITDEFCSMKKTGDVMAQFDAVVEGDMDDSYQIQEDNVNSNKKSKESREGEMEDSTSKGKTNLKRKIIEMEKKQSRNNSSKKKNRSSKT